VERANHTIVDMAKDMLHAENFNKSLWAEAVGNAMYTQNECLIKTLPFMIPQETWSGRKPSIKYMRVFG